MPKLSTSVQNALTKAMAKVGLANEPNFRRMDGSEVYVPPPAPQPAVAQLPAGVYGPPKPVSLVQRPSSPAPARPAPAAAVKQILDRAQQVTSQPAATIRFDRITPSIFTTPEGIPLRQIEEARAAAQAGKPQLLPLTPQTSSAKFTTAQLDQILPLTSTKDETLRLIPKATGLLDKARVFGKAMQQGISEKQDINAAQYGPAGKMLGAPISAIGAGFGAAIEGIGEKSPVKTLGGGVTAVGSVTPVGMGIAAGLSAPLVEDAADYVLNAPSKVANYVNELGKKFFGEDLGISLEDQPDDSWAGRELKRAATLGWQFFVFKRAMEKAAPQTTEQVKTEADRIMSKMQLTEQSKAALTKIAQDQRGFVSLGGAEPPVGKPSPFSTALTTDKFGNKFDYEQVKPSDLVRQAEFQPRVTESGKGTEQSVFEKGYQEGMVDQPLLIWDNGTQKVVLGGHSRTKGLERRSEAGLENPEAITARVYRDITPEQAKQISRAANQGGQYESTLDMAKSIAESVKEGTKPEVQKQNMVKGFGTEDYAKLWDIAQTDSGIRTKIAEGAIPAEDALFFAREGRTRELKTPDIVETINSLDQAGKLTRPLFKTTVALKSGLQKAGVREDMLQTLFSMDEAATKSTINLVERWQKEKAAATREQNAFDSVKKSLEKSGEEVPEVITRKLKESQSKVSNIEQELVDKIKTEREAQIAEAKARGEDLTAAKPQEAPAQETLQQELLQPTETAQTKVSSEATLSALKERVKKIEPTITPADRTKWEKVKREIKNSEVALRLQETVQDAWIRVKRLAEREGVKLTDDSNPYLAETLFHGRVAERITEARDQIAKLDSDLVKTAKELARPDGEIKQLVDDYLIARHAPERNAALKNPTAAGITDLQAKSRMANIEADPNFPKIKELAERLQDINNETLVILRDGQVITPELYDMLKNRYKNHVPLQRVLEGQEFDEVLVGGKGFGVKGTGIKAAKGSELEVKDIWGNVLANLQSAITRSEKNRVDLNTLNFFRNNKETLKDVFEEQKPKVIGQTSDGRPIFAPNTDPAVLSLRENGKPVSLRIKDAKIAEALQGLNKEQVGTTLRLIATVTRFYSGLATRFNPEFAFSNIVRDAQDLIVNMSADLGTKSAARAASSVPENMKAITDYLRGKESAGSKLYKQMRLDGGTTGGLSLSTRQQLDLDLAALYKQNRSTPRRLFNQAIEAVDKWNSIFEDSTRLGAYRAALESGLSRAKAAEMAKNATVNFNRKGTAGTLINSLYMFSNASIQGSARILKSLSNPKVAATVTALVGSIVASTRSWNDAQDPDWREKIDPYEGNANLVIVLPPAEDGTFRRIKIPVSWGLRPIKAIADNVYDNANGKGKGFAESVGNIVSTLWEAYNPVGGTDFISAATPTILDLPVDIARNKKWSGSMVRPEWLAGLPKIEQVFESTKEGGSFKDLAAMKTAEVFSKIGLDTSPEDLKYVFEQLVGGAGRAATRAFDTVTSPFRDGKLEPKDAFLINRFYGETAPEQVKKAVEKKADTQFIDSLKEVPKEQRVDLMQEYVLEHGAEDGRGMLFRLRDMGFDTTGVPTSFTELNTDTLSLYDKFKELPVDKKKAYLATMSENSKEGLAKIVNAERNPDAVTNTDGTTMTTAQYYAHMRKVRILNGEAPEDIPAKMPKGWQPPKDVERKMKVGRRKDERLKKSREAAERRAAQSIQP